MHARARTRATRITIEHYDSYSLNHSGARSLPGWADRRWFCGNVPDRARNVPEEAPSQLCGCIRLVRSRSEADRLTIVVSTCRMHLCIFCTTRYRGFVRRLAL